MRVFFNFSAVLSFLLIHCSVHAAVMGSASIQVDWSTVVIGGVPVVASSYQDPTDGYTTVYSYTYGDTSPFTESLDYFFTNNGLPFAISSGAGPVQASAGFGSGINYASVDIDNAGAGAATAMAWNGTGYIYQANATGQLSFQIDYSLLASANIGAAGESLGAGYDVYLYMWDVDLFAATFETLYASNGGDYNAAYRQANNVSFITDDYFAGTLLNCTSVGSCVASQSGTFTTAPLLFDVQAGTNYGMEVYVQMTGDSVSTVVPVPGSGWFFASALMGIALVSRRRAWI